jgi:hypothetical protein
MRSGVYALFSPCPTRLSWIVPVLNQIVMAQCSTGSCMYCMEGLIGMTYLSILFVGDYRRGRALQAAVGPLGWQVYLPADLTEALGMYISYMPSATIIDGTTRYAEEFYTHLYSVDARPIGILSDEIGSSEWTTQPALGMWILPHDATADDIIVTLSEEFQPMELMLN